MMLWNILWDMYIFSYYLITIIQICQKFPFATCNMVAVLHLPIEQGSGPYKVPFLHQPVLLTRNTWNLVSVQK